MNNNDFDSFVSYEKETPNYETQFIQDQQYFNENQTSNIINDPLNQNLLFDVNDNYSIDPPEIVGKENGQININQTFSQNVDNSNNLIPQENIIPENNNIIVPSNIENQESLTLSQKINNLFNQNNIQNSGKMPLDNTQKQSVTEFQAKKLKNKYIKDPNLTLMGKEVHKAMPVYNLIREGRGISRVEEQGIVFCAMAIFQEEMQPLSNNTAKYIQMKLGGDWLVIVYPEEKPIDYYLTFVSKNDFMYFNLDTTAFLVCRLR